MIQLFIFNIRHRLSDWLLKPDYQYVDYIVEQAGKL